MTIQVGYLPNDPRPVVDDDCVPVSLELFAEEVGVASKLLRNHIYAGKARLWPEFFRVNRKTFTTRGAIRRWVTTLTSTHAALDAMDDADVAFAELDRLEEVC